MIYALIRIIIITVTNRLEKKDLGWKKKRKEGKTATSCFMQQESNKRPKTEFLRMLINVVLKDSQCKPRGALVSLNALDATDSVETQSCLLNVLHTIDAQEC